MALMAAPGMAYGQEEAPGGESPPIDAGPPPADVEPGPPPEPGPEPDPRPYLEVGGRVVIEVETGSPTVVSDRAWLPSSLSGAVGAAMFAGPDGGPAIPMATAAQAAPSIGIPVRFSSAGVYHVWVRAWAPNPKGDSLHVGLNGAVQPFSGYLTTKAYRQWNWFRGRVSYPPARVTVPSAGVHTVNVWMREDGLHLDRMQLNRDPLGAPSGVGPPASARDESEPDTPEL